MKYAVKRRPRRWPRRVFVLAIVGVVLVVGITFAVRQFYFVNLKAVDGPSQAAQLVTIESGSTVDEIAKQLEDAGLIRSAWAFKLYVSSKEVRGDLQAGTYSLDVSQSVPEIVAQLTHGKVVTDLVTILPGQRLDQVRETLINDGFSASDVDDALDASNYSSSPALVDKPAGASLEGYLYPDSFQKTSKTIPGIIVEQSLEQMDKQLTPELRAAFAAQGLSTYQGIILASMVEQEASTQGDRDQVAQVFLSRLHMDTFLGSDVTAFYGSRLAGQGNSVKYDSPYNTRIHKGLPPTPISNVSGSSLHAVAYPASTSWLYFVAGDDGVIHYSKTLAEHEAATDLYCHELCKPQ